MITIKKYDIDTRVYKGFNKDSENYIIEDGMCNEFEMNYFKTQGEIIQWINIVMDINTEIIVIPAKEVLDCHINEGYFYY